MNVDWAELDEVVPDVIVADVTVELAEVMPEAEADVPVDAVPDDVPEAVPEMVPEDDVLCEAVDVLFVAEVDTVVKFPV